MTASHTDDLPARGRLLVVVRHGRAEPYGDEDQRRLLTERGRREAREAGEWLAARGLLPDHALVSSAARTRGTWEELSAGAGSDCEPSFSDDVYAANVDTALEVLRGVPAGAVTVLYLGHNPTVGSLAHVLDDGDPDPEAFRVVSGGFPTAAVAVLEVPVPWSELDAATAHLVASHVPERH